MDIHVSFRQKKNNKSLCKVIALAAIPMPGCHFEYEDGWGLCYLTDCNCPGMNLSITATDVEIDGYGPQFSEDEIASLKKLGWIEQ